MEQCRDFARNLEAIRRSKNLSLVEFSESLNVPRSTLQDILKDGHTTLDTALRIARQLDVPLSILTGEVIPKENFDALAILLHYFEWFGSLSSDNQRVVAKHVWIIMEVIRKDRANPSKSAVIPAKDHNKGW